MITSLVGYREWVMMELIAIFICLDKGIFDSSYTNGVVFSGFKIRGGSGTMPELQHSGTT
jgi:hypothetical protein